MALSRVTIPAEFFDITSGMLLKAPLPQYAFAQMAIAAQSRAALMATDAEAALMGQRGAVSQGASVGGLEGNQLVLAQSVYAEAIMAIEDASKSGVGETIRFNRPLFSGGSYTSTARTINQAQTISVTPVEVGMEQTSITVKRHAGPYDSTNSRVAPFAIDRLASMRSVHSLVQLAGMHLVQDRMATLDGIFSLLFDAAATNVVRPSGITADASFPTSGEAPLDLDMVLRAEEKLHNAGIPRFSDGTYLMIVSPTQIRQLKLDPDYKSAAQVLPEKNPLTNSAVVMIGDTIRVMVSSTVQTDTSSASGSTIYRGTMMGPGALGFGVADPCRAAYSQDDNYGETAKVIWIAYEGMGVLDERFLCSIRSV